MTITQQKKLLSLDGGGIMGLISIGVLKEIEQQVRDIQGDQNFLLRDFFDYVGGTSTGAIIAAGISVGMTINEIEDIYTSLGEEMFDCASLLRRWRYAYDADNLQDELKARFGTESILELQKNGTLRTDRHLMVVTRNVNTDSAWPISSNPAAMFNDVSRPDCNLHLPLWQLVRASTAAPTFFAPEKLVLKNGQSFYFEDGGVTAYNNPAFLLYRMATEPAYQCNWPTGEENLMVVSIGTGMAFRTLKAPNEFGESVLSSAKTIPSELMRAMAVEQDIACRTIGRCTYGAELDMEIGALMSEPDGARPKAFTYARYDADVSQNGLNKAGLSDIRASDLAMDNASQISELLRIGENAAQQVNLLNQFECFVTDSN